MLWFLAVSIVGVFVFTRPSVQTGIVKKYTQFRELNRFVAKRYKPISKILWVSMSLVAKMYWLQFLQWMNNSVQTINPRTTVISYVLYGKMYKIVVRPRKGPSGVLLVLDQNDNDVSDLVIPYIGPGQDWHRWEFTPSFWGYKSLTFELSSGETRTFSEQDTINLI